MFYSLYYLLSLAGLAILAVLYGSLLHFFLQWLLRKRWSKLHTYGLVFVGLIIWQNSYWGKKSGPEYERIPLGDQLEVRKRGEEPYLSAVVDQNKKVLVRTKEFIKTGNRVYGKTPDEKPEAYFILDIPTRRITWLSAEAYDKQVQQAGIPSKEQLRSYKQNWENHWGNRIIALLY
ncbi:hypothetical protein Q0590_01710 [Rhodocytophaga aerolata]|uniref:DUF4131 domain-containing protein n=1 Tax=Rhodocytophaga aerolata TaxID=455078 RepID=A0ABT8QYN2_9BACT|nr:hypothetical protein [Rhodocytophaga aerolata]MDO1444944.1 hypothetical protein [Rhodocytophaga aerolata]